MKEKLFNEPIESLNMRFLIIRHPLLKPTELWKITILKFGTSTHSMAIFNSYVSLQWGLCIIERTDSDEVPQLFRMFFRGQIKHVRRPHNLSQLAAMENHHRNWQIFAKRNVHNGKSP